MNPFLRLDRQLFLLLNERWHAPFLDWLMPRLTNANKTIPFWTLVVIWAAWLWRKGGQQGRVLVVVLVLVLPIADQLSTRMMKYVFLRVRPSAPVLIQGVLQTPVPGVRLLPPGSRPLTSPSFPSSHATTMSALATVLIWRYRRKSRWIWLALLFPLIIGYSRIYVGVHYPLDVLGGWILGFCIAAVGCWLARRWEAGLRRPQDDLSA